MTAERIAELRHKPSMFRTVMAYHLTECLDEIERLQGAALECPWPDDVWTMTQDEYVRAVPDEQLRTSISGFLMRRGWELAIKAIQSKT